MNAIRNNIPNAITCLNLLAGVLAIVVSFTPGTICGLESYQAAAALIGLAALFDFCDGFAARLIHAVSAIGKELDSLADLVSFGLAPAMMLLNAIPAEDPLRWAALLIPVAGAIRLARFNLDDNQSVTFTGLPIPANAIFWIGFVAWMHSFVMLPGAVVAPIVVLLSYLMISPIRMFSLKFKNLSFADNVLRYAIILGAILFVAFGGLSGLMWTIVFYVAMSALSRSTRNS